MRSELQEGKTMASKFGMSKACAAFFRREQLDVQEVPAVIELHVEPVFTIIVNAAVNASAAFEIVRPGLLRRRATA